VEIKIFTYAFFLKGGALQVLIKQHLINLSIVRNQGNKFNSVFYIKKYGIKEQQKATLFNWQKKKKDKTRKKEIKINYQLNEFSFTPTFLYIIVYELVHHISKISYITLYTIFVVIRYRVSN